MSVGKSYLELEHIIDLVKLLLVSASHKHRLAQSL
jgi:hypothetical protein